MREISNRLRRLGQLLVRPFGGQAAKRRRPFLVAASCVSILFLLVAVLLILGPARIAERVIAGVLNEQGLAPVALRVTHLGLDGLEIADLSAGTALQVRGVRISFAGLGLGAVDVQGARAQLIWDGAALKVGDKALGPGGTGASKAGPLLPFPIKLRDTEATLDGAGLRLTVSAPGEVTLASGGGQGHFDVGLAPLAVDAPIGPHHGTLDVAVSADKRLHTHLVLAPRTREGRALATNLDATVGAATDGSQVDAAAALSGLSAPDLGVAVESVRLRTVRAPGKSEIDVGFAADGVAVPGGTKMSRVALQGRLVPDKTAARLYMEACGAVTELTLPSLTADLVKLCATKADAPVVTIELGETALDLAIKSTRIAVRARDQTRIAAGQSPDLWLTGTLKGNAWHAHLKAEGGDLSLQGREMRLTDLLLTGELAGQGATLGTGRLDVTNAHIKDWTAAPLFTPLTFAGEGTVNGPSIAIIATASDDNKAPIGQATGTHELASGAGRLDLSLVPQTFVPGGHQAETVLPFLKGMIKAARGTITGKAAFAWTPKTVSSSAALGIKELGFTTALASVEGVNGNVELGSLLPPKTARPQKIRVRMMDIGLPLPDGNLEFTVNPDRTLNVRKAVWSFLDGTVGLSSGVFGGGDRQNATLAVSHVDLEKLLQLIDIKGLSGTGRISGALPIVLTKDAQTITGGRLAADAPGTLVYVSDASADGQTKLLFDAVKNFHYDDLSTTLDGNISGELSLGIHLKGRNPDLYNGYPVELNVSTAGAFVSMIRNGLYAYRSPAGGTP